MSPWLINLYMDVGRILLRKFFSGYDGVRLGWREI